MIDNTNRFIKLTLLCLLLTTLFPLQFALAQNDSNGRVGIGTTNPQAKLHVAGDLQVEDLSGEGNRTLVATPEGKLKAITNSEPAPSNGDTIRAKFIELVDDEGDTKFIINAHTGQFQMLDDDTLWYELQVNSPIKVTERQLDGEQKVSSDQEDLNIEVAGAIGNIEDDEFLANRDEALDLLENGTITRVHTEVTDESFSSISNTEEATKTFFINTPEGDKVVLQFNVTSTFEAFSDPRFEVSSLEIRGKKPSKSQTSKEIQEDVIIQTTRDTDLQSTTTTVTEINDLDGDETKSQIKQGIDENDQPFENLTDFFNFLNNSQTPSENTITNTETGNSVSTQIDDGGNPQIQFTMGGSTVEIDAENVSVTKDGNTEQASVEQVVNSAQNFDSKNQEQDSQINQNKDDISSLDDRVTDVENNSGGGSGTTAEKFTASKDGSTNELQSEATVINAADGNKAEFKKDGVLLEAPDGTQFFVDCNGISKLNSSKSLGFAGIGFNADDNKVVVHVDLEVFGSITELGKKVTKIDHPDNPTNQYLQHTFIGTNELLNEYSGNITTDSNGKATVQLPEYVSALNTDFRYQLTVIGSFAQAIVAEEINDNQFVIRTNESNVKVSWQVAGVRQDVYAQQNPLEVEVPKENTQIGTTLYDSTAKAFTPTLNRKAALQEEIDTADVE